MDGFLKGLSFNYGDKVLILYDFIFKYLLHIAWVIILCLYSLILTCKTGSHNMLHLIKQSPPNPTKSLFNRVRKCLIKTH